MNKFINFLMKLPIKIIIFSLIIIFIGAVGITRVTLETGNDTLLSDKTDIYKDNDSYQKEFGKEPIILIFTEEDEMLSYETLTLINTLQNEINYLKGIFTINSPVTLINQISEMMYEETENGLKEVGNTLIMISENINDNDITDKMDFQQMETMLNSLIDAQNNLSDGLDGIFNVLNMIDTIIDSILLDLSNVEPNKILENQQEYTKINQQTNQIKVMIENLKNTDDLKSLPMQTKFILSMMLNQFSSLQTDFEEMGVKLDKVSNALSTIGNNLLTMSNNFNAFAPTFPTKKETIDIMVENGGDNFDNFIVGQDENKLRMVVVLDYKVNDEQTDLIIKSLFDKIEELEVEDKVLVSGKPVLDRAVKSSMMGSMAVMMITAIVIMFLILIIFYRVRMNLLPMFMMLLVVVATIGIMGWISVGMTMVSMAVFPILIGLGIDYFVQFQTRYEEEVGLL